MTITSMLTFILRLRMINNRMLMQGCLAVAFTLAEPLSAQSIYQRPTAIRATIAGSPKIYDGSFSGSGKANMCGLIPAMSSLTGTDVFVIEYPNDDPGNAGIQSLSFGSKQLVGKVKKATLFTLNVSVRLPNGSKPYPYALNTDEPTKPNNTGTVTLANIPGGVRLTLSGRNDRGGTINLAVECK